MATLTRGQNFAVTETVTNTKLHNLVDLATITGIVDADISPSAAIQFSKLLASSISGALLTNLNLIPSAAGLIPFANIPVPFGSTYCSLVTIPNQSLQPLTLASWVDGVALRNLCSTPVDKQIRYNLLVSSVASGGYIAYNGAYNFVGANLPQTKHAYVSTFPGSYANAENYKLPLGGSFISTIASIGAYMPFTGTLKNTRLLTTQGNQSCTLMKNGATTAMQISFVNPGLYTDLTNQITFNAGDFLSWGFGTGNMGTVVITSEVDVNL